MSFKDSVQVYLTDAYPNYAFYHVFQTQFPSELLAVEPKHPQSKTTIKIAFLYSLGNETTLQDFFNHKETSPAYMTFLDILGEKMNLKGWKKYRGDFGAEVQQDSYYSSWKGIEIMFHICHWLTPEQHRRLIGNDVVVIIFHDSSNPFVPDPISNIGTVPQIFGVVSPHEDKYRVGFFSRPNIKPYAPHIPVDYLFTADKLKDFVFTKAYNGYCQALTCPPMNRLYELPRGEELSHLINAFPQHDDKFIKKMEENQKRRLLHIAASAKGDPLILMATVMQLNPSRTSTMKSGYVQVSLCQQECQTKKSETGNFNEVLVFVLAGINPALNHLEIKMFDYSYIDQISSYSEVASAQLCFIDICQQLGEPFLLSLRRPSYILFGTLQVMFKLTGPGSTLCPKCGFYLGFERFISWKSFMYHSLCVSCEICRARLAGTQFKIRSENDQNATFFCNRCYDKKFGDDQNFEQSELSTSQSRLGREMDSPHVFEKSESLPPLGKCGFCTENLKKSNKSLKSSGYECSGCKYLCHKECVDFVPDDCTKDSKTAYLHGLHSENEVKKGYRKSVQSKVKSFSTLSRQKEKRESIDLSSVYVTSPVLTAMSPVAEAEVSSPEPTSQSRRGLLSRRTVDGKMEGQVDKKKDLSASHGSSKKRLKEKREKS